MKRLEKVWTTILTFILITAFLCPAASGEERWHKNDPTKDELNMIDLLVARPVGIAAGIIGTAVFIVSLPFTIPTGSVQEAGRMFIVEPFKFSFVREFPDESF